jgi:hypothetical protein
MYQVVQLSRPFVIVILAALAITCNNINNPPTTQQNANESDSGQIIVKYQNTIFTIPSPQQINLFIRKSSKSIDRNRAIEPANVQHYSSSVKQALNLGVLGADLGYVNLFLPSDNNQAYTKAIKKLVNDLGLSAVITADILKEIQNNASNSDSLLKLISEVYALSDQYLNENGKQQISSLILSGGWVESIYLISQTYKENKQNEYFRMLAQQKFPLENIIKLLSTYYNSSNEIAQLTDDLVDLAYDFEIVDFKNSTEQPTIDKENDIITINNTSEIIQDSTRINDIIQKISDIRKNIIE